MSTNSTIEWTDTTWNPVRGCTKVSPGCKNCYAETFAERWRGVKGHPYEQGFDLRLVPEKLTEPLTWKKPRRVFVNSMSDLFQDGVPFSFIDKAFAVMSLAPQHTFQVLTKRADRMLEYVKTRAYTSPGWVEARCAIAIPGVKDGSEEWKRLIYTWPKWPLSNVWLGVSVENQHFADERIPLLLQTPAAVRFISAEPLLGEIAVQPYLKQRCLSADSFDAGRMDPEDWSRRLDWVIVGGESGHGARQFALEWARSLVGQCRAAGVPCFVKQLGARPTGQEGVDFCDGPEIFGHPSREVLTMPVGAGDRLVLSKKGGDPSEWPKDLRVREFPRSAV